MNYYLRCFKKYATFEGRARRAEYWQFTLIHMIIMIILAVMMEVNESFTFLYIGYAILSLLPGLAVLVRRLHDVGKSGWFYFIALIPLVGAIWLLVLECRDGEYGMNKYGANPKDRNNGTAQWNI